MATKYHVDLYRYQTFMRSDTFDTRLEAMQYASAWLRVEPRANAAHIKPYKVK